MITQELVAYIQSQLHHEEEASIKSRLLLIGWSQEDINNAFSSLNVPSGAMQEDHPPDSLHAIANTTVNNQGVPTNKSEQKTQMEPSDFWTHICIVTMAFLTTVLPGSIAYGFTSHTAIYITGAVTLVCIALIWRNFIERNTKST